MIIHEVTFVVETSFTLYLKSEISYRGFGIRDPQKFVNNFTVVIGTCGS